jgi:hypothetical protein
LDLEKWLKNYMLNKYYKNRWNNFIIPVETFMMSIIKAAYYMIWVVAAATEHASWNEEI